MTDHGAAAFAAAASRPAGRAGGAPMRSAAYSASAMAVNIGARVTLVGNTLESQT